MQVIITTSDRSDRRIVRTLAALRDLHPPDRDPGDGPGLRTVLLDADPRRAGRRLPPPTLGLDDPFVVTLAGDDERPGHWGGHRYGDLWLCGGAAAARWAAIPAVADRLFADGILDRSRPVLVIPARSLVREPLDDLVVSVAADQIGLVPRRLGPREVGVGGWVPDVVVIGGDCAELLRWWSATAAATIMGGHRAPRRGTGAGPTDPASSAPNDKPVDIALDAPLVHLDLTDPWRDFVLGGEAIVALDDPTVALHPLTLDTVGLDHPIRLAQFPWFDPGRPWWWSTDGRTAPRRLVGTTPALAQLVREYATDAAGAHTSTSEDDDALAGITLLPTTRELLRRRAAVAPLPLPFDGPGTEDFVALLRGPGEVGLDATGISLAVDAVWAHRPDLAAAFPHIRWRSRHDFLRWLWTYGVSEGMISTALLPPLPGPAPAPKPPGRRFGVNLVGYHGAELGLGVAVRRVGRALTEAGVPWAPVSYDRTFSRVTTPRAGSDGGGSDGAVDTPYLFNLLLIAPDQLDFFADDVGPEFFEGHYNIGLWFWETDVLHDRQRQALRHVDEVWAPTRYLADVFGRYTDKPVHHVPVPLEFEVEPVDEAVRRRLGLDDRFTFLFSFDFLSVAQRKNPLGLLDAYCRAFGPDEDTRLILKSINARHHVDDAEAIRAAIAGRPDVELRDAQLDAADRMALIAAADCYVSLHRSEGLGLTMAEAMASGTPVIATRYSGNLDFTRDDNSLLVDCDVVEIGPGSFYPAPGHWADPALDHAARLMARIADDQQLHDRLSSAGRAALAPFTVRRVGARMAERLAALGRGRGTGAASVDRRPIAAAAPP
ncbi:MAG: glycosyltransferase [Microthrixaceae bacterium]